MERYYLKTLLQAQLGKGYKIDSRIYGGMMNVSYIVLDKKGNKYIVYIPNGKANKTVDRVLEKENTEIVANLGLTSELIYFDTVRGIKIKRFIEGVSLDKYQGEIDYQKVADLLHLLHDSKSLAREDYHPFDRLAIYENRALSYAKESNRYRSIRDFLSTHIKYLEVKEKVFSHNDFQKSNIVVGDDGKYYVIDFEFAANNDEIYDIATFANNSIEDGEKLLEHYFINPDKNKYQRFYLWRVFVSLQWCNVAISKHYQKEGANTAFNFLKVADYFLDNAEKAIEKFLAL